VTGKPKIRSCGGSLMRRCVLSRLSDVAGEIPQRPGPRGWRLILDPPIFAELNLGLEINQFPQPVLKLEKRAYPTTDCRETCLGSSVDILGGIAKWHGWKRIDTAD
jgi:hypothetical protein